MKAEKNTACISEQQTAALPPPQAGIVNVVRFQVCVNREVSALLALIYQQR